MARASMGWGLSVALMLVPAAVPPSALGEVRRCSGPDGTTIYTDRRCRDIGSFERLPRDHPTQATTRLHRGGCATTLQDLAYELSAAIDSRDVNRLASIHHWVGVSSRSAELLMRRLDVIVKRPLVDIEPIEARSPASAMADPVITPEGEVILPPPQPRRAPVGLRLHQTLGNGSTPQQTVFGLQRHFGCWWLRL